MIETQPLVTKWMLGDEHAARLLYDQYRDRTFRLAYGLVGNTQDAEEVAQDALTYALVNIDKYKPEKAQFGTWLHTITVSRARDKLRKRRFTSVSLTSWMERGGDVVDSAPTPAGHSEKRLRRETVIAAVSQLTPQLREAIVLRYWSGHSFREISDILEIPLGTAQSRVRRGFEQLRDHLSSETDLEIFSEAAS